MSKKNNIDNNTLYNMLYNKFYLLSLQVFQWDGLEDINLSQRVLEKILFNSGACAFYNDEMNGKLLLNCGGARGFNIMGEPTHYHITGVNYSKIVDVDDIVLIRNNDLMLPTNLIVHEYVKRLCDIQRTIDINVSQQKTPYIVLCDNRQLLTMKNLLKKVNENEINIFADKDTLNLSNITTLDTKADYKGGELRDLYHDIENELLTVIGINNANTDKRERLVTDEVNANNEFIDLNLQLMLQCRQTACDQINKKFGLNLTVKRRVENVKVHDGIKGDNSTRDTNI